VKGAVLRQELRCAVTPAGLTLDFGVRQGSFAPWWKEIAVTVHGWQGGASVKGASVTTDAAERTARFTLPDQKRAAKVVVARQ
jgi:alpha-glucosidase